MAEAKPIKLRAHDPEDLQVVAACLQDALVPLGDLAYLKPEKRFVMVANRFRWELKATGDGADHAEPAPAAADARFEEGGEAPGFERVNCGVCFDRVQSVRFRGLDPANKDRILNLLTIEATPRQVTLVFSDQAAIRLQVSAIACHLEDLGEPWPTHWRPSHGLEEPSGRDQSGASG